MKQIQFETLITHQYQSNEYTLVFQNKTMDEHVCNCRVWGLIDNRRVFMDVSVSLLFIKEAEHKTVLDHVCINAKWAFNRLVNQV